MGHRFLGRALARRVESCPLSDLPAQGHGSTLIFLVILRLAWRVTRPDPKTVADLENHDLLIYSHANHPNSMEFTRGEERASVKIQPSMESNDGQIVRAAALAGAGILVQPKYIIYDDLVAGRLLPVLDDWDLPRLTINLAFQDRRYMPAKTRLFIDFLLEHFKKEGYERYWTR